MTGIPGERTLPHPRDQFSNDFWPPRVGDAAGKFAEVVPVESRHFSRLTSKLCCPPPSECGLLEVDAIPQEDAKLAGQLRRLLGGGHLVQAS